MDPIFSRGISVLNLGLFREISDKKTKVGRLQSESQVYRPLCKVSLKLSQMVLVFLIGGLPSSLSGHSFFFWLCPVMSGGAWLSSYIWLSSIRSCFVNIYPLTSAYICFSLFICAVSVKYLLISPYIYLYLFISIHIRSHLLMPGYVCSY